MIFKILLSLTIIIQFAAFVIAIKMTRRTKFNSAWILYALAMLIINTQLIHELVIIFGLESINYRDYMVWSTIIVSLSLSIGVFYMEKIISYIEAIERYRNMYDKRLLSSMMSAEENERQRIAKELHDGLGPLLSSAKMSLSYAAKESTPHKNKEEIMNRIKELIDESVHSVREISNNLSPNTLSTFGLKRALTSFINKLPLPPERKIYFNTNIKQERFDSETEILLYRVCSELINNSLKHSKASELNLLIEHQNDKIFLQFSDNGIGFDYDKLKNEPDGLGLGLSNIESRVSLLNGSVSMDNEIGKGSKTTIHVPIKYNKKSRLWIK